MTEKAKSFSIIRLNDWSEDSWGVVDNGSGSLVHIDGLAMRLSKERARVISDELNAQAREAGTAAEPDAGAQDSPDAKPEIS